MSEETKKPFVVVATGVVCPGCQQPVYAGVYHKCGQPYRIGGPDGEIIDIPAPPPAAFSREFSEPPQVAQTTDRARCEACGEPVAPDVFHKCMGNSSLHKAAMSPAAADVSSAQPQPSQPTPDPAAAGPVEMPQLREVTHFAGSTQFEQQKYERMWAHEQYRQVSPGEEVAPLFCQVAKPRDGATIIDFGCGTGRGGLAIAILMNTGGKNVDMTLVDFAANSLDPHVIDTINANRPDGPTKIRFAQAPLEDPFPPSLVAEFGYCTDVMEHIPPDLVDRVIQNIMQTAQHVFFQIALKDDVCGALIDEPLHLSVHTADWWLAKFSALGAQVHYTEHDQNNLVVYATAWSTGQDVVDVGVLNVAEEAIKANVRANSGAGWLQVEPHLPNDKEVLLIGGGPSLPAQLETIRFLRERGAILVTMNGAFQWALDQGLSVSGQIVVDARDFNARFTHPRVDNPELVARTHYLIGSQVDPATLEGLPKERTFLWNTSAELIQDILEEVVGTGKWYGVVGGSTVLTRAIPLLRMLGYMKFHLFGCDSCLEQKAGDWSDHRHHAYAQVENDGHVVLPVIVGGRRFDCHPWMLAQAQEFMNLIRYLGDLFEIEVHGGGLLSWILQHASDQQEIKDELKRAREMT